MLFLAAEAGVMTMNGTVTVELITFLIMLAILAGYVYPEIVKLGEARQLAIAQQLKEAEQARVEAEQRLKDAAARLEDARKTAQSVIDAATKSGEQLRQELKQKAEEESKRTVEAARKDIEAERERAVQSVRSEVANLVVAATEKVIGETLDDAKHRQLIDKAIQEGASGNGSSQAIREGCLRAGRTGSPGGRLGPPSYLDPRIVLGPRRRGHADQPDDRHRAAHGADLGRSARFRPRSDEPREAAHRVEPTQGHRGD